MAQINALHGTISIPGDKSISHRAAILASLSTGKTVIDNFLFSDDCLRTLDAFQAMGVQVKKQDQQVIIDSEGASKLSAPTMRLTSVIQVRQLGYWQVCWLPCRFKRN